MRDNGKLVFEQLHNPAFTNAVPISSRNRPYKFRVIKVQNTLVRNITDVLTHEELQELIEQNYDVTVVAPK